LLLQCNFRFQKNQKNQDNIDLHQASTQRKKRGLTLKHMALIFLIVQCNNPDFGPLAAILAQSQGACHGQDAGTVHRS
jgi:hypothetical protein